MKNGFFMFFFFSLISHAQVCEKAVENESLSSSIQTFDLAQIADKNGLELRFESYLEKDLHLITSSPGRLRFVVSFADATAATYPRKWCSLNFVPENSVDLVELISDWDSCKAIAFRMRDYSKNLSGGVVIHASTISGSARLKLKDYCTP